MAKPTVKQAEIDDYKNIDPLKLPKHVSIIMDGNGRWAEQRKKSRLAGHRAGVKTMRQIVQIAAKMHIEVLSLFAFSSENWRRPKKEVNHLMRQFLFALQNDVKDLHADNVQLHIVGDLEQFSPKLRKYIEKSMQLTKNNTGLKLVIAANYGGQWDIVQATKKITQECLAGKIKPEDINAESFAKYLMIADLPNPDLFIRTSGEQRISNFFLWQLAYTELYFTPILWPDFDEKAFLQALQAYAARTRKFGLTSKQVEKKHV